MDGVIDKDVPQYENHPKVEDENGIGGRINRPNGSNNANGIDKNLKPRVTFAIPDLDKRESLTQTKDTPKI